MRTQYVHKPYGPNGVVIATVNTRNGTMVDHQTDLLGHVTVFREAHADRARLSDLHNATRRQQAAGALA